MTGTRLESSNSVDTSARVGMRTLIGLILFVVCMLPIIVATLFQPSSTTIPGRVGLLLPALLLADDAARMVLWRGLIGSGLSAGLALSLGIGLGLMAAGLSSRVSKFLLEMVLLPGRCPAWVFPLGWVVLVQRFSGFGTFANMPLLLWLGWAGWWGGLRLADAIRKQALQVNQSQWDAAKMAGANHWLSARVVLKPFVLADVRQELRTVVGVALFDPTPVIFWGLSHWPMGFVVAGLREKSMLGASQAATWAFGLMLILAFWFGVIQLMTRSRHSVELHETDMQSSSAKVFPTRNGQSPVALFMLFGLWPWVALVVGFKSFLHQPIRDFIDQLQPSSIIPDGLFLNAWLGGVLAGLLAALILSLIASRVTKLEQLRLRRLVVAWPVGLVALGMSILIRFQVSAASHQVIALLLSPPVLGLVCPLLIVLLALGQPYGDRLADSVETALNQVSSSAYEAALMIGATSSRASRLAGRSGIQDLYLKQVMQLFVGWWWVWAAPAWGMAGLLVGSGEATWGGFLVSRWAVRPEWLVLYWLLTVLPVVVAKLTQALAKR